MKDKKTLLITFDFPPQVTGIGTYLSGIWKNRDKDNNCILAPAFKFSKEADAISNFKVIRYPGFGRIKILRTIILLAITFYLIIRHRIEVIFCSVPLSIGFIGLIFKIFLGLPYGVFYYGGEYAKFKGKWFIWPLLNLIMKNSDFVITISEFSCAEAAKFGLSRDTIFKVTPGVDTNNYMPLPDSGKIRGYLKLENKKVILTVARLVRRKGAHLVIQALNRLIKDFPDLIYLIVGSGEEEDNLKKLARDIGLERRVIFFGYVSNEDLPIYYNACDIYVMPNIEVKAEDNIEGFGISFIEASSCSKPVIGGISGGARDAVLDGVTGLLVDPDKPDELVQAIRKLLIDPGFAEELGRQGRLRVENEFSLNLRARQIEAIIKKVRNNDL